MRRCETCKHWDAPSTGPTRPADQGWGTCRWIGDERDMLDPSDPHSQLAVAVDSESWSAWFDTRAEFGCVEHTVDEITEGSNT